MRTHCPFCGTALPQTDDAFCGECRGRLDEAPEEGLVRAPVPRSDVELRERLSLGSADALTPLDVLICVCVPCVGVIVGSIRVSQGKASGQKMLLISAICFLLSLVARLLLVLPQR